MMTGIGADSVLTAAEDMVSRSLAALDWPELLAKVKARAPSGLAQAALEESRFAETEDEAKRLLAETAELAGALAEGEPVPSLGVADVLPLVGNASKGGTLDGGELRQIAEAVEHAGRARRFFSKHPGRMKNLAAIAGLMNPPEDLGAEITRAISEDGTVSERASPDMKAKAQAVEAARSAIRRAAEKLLESPKYRDLLQESFFTLRADRYVLPMRASAEAFKAGIVHDQSGSGATLFVEPRELVNLNNKLRLAELELEREIARILAALTHMVAAKAREITVAIEVMARLGAISARALFSLSVGGRKPEIAGEPVVELRAASHPLLLSGGGGCVPNDLVVGKPARTLVISGPNSGGKSVALKTIGLAALMARAGLLLPCGDGSRIGFFSPVLADVGDPQSVVGDLSTFSGHMRNIVMILREVSGGGGRPLVLLDELMVGTDPGQGAALGRAILAALADMNVPTVVTTHFDGLKALAAEDRRFENAAMGFAADTLGPDFRLKYGIPGRSYAFDIASRMSLPEDVIEAARRESEERGGRLEDIVQRLEQREKEIAAERDRLAKASEELEKAKAGHEAAVERVLRAEESLKAEARGRIEAEVEKAKEEVRRAVRTAVEAGRDRVVIVRRRLDRAEREAKEKLSSSVAETEKPPPKGLDPSEVRAGMEVFVKSFGRKGTVVEEPDRKGRVTVKFDRAKVVVGIGEIERAVAEKAAGDERNKASYSITSPAEKLDVRGLMAYEAIEKVVSLLDRAMVEEMSPVCIIHGHGTGALKKAIRAYLSGSPYVRSFEPAPLDQGGDGVTVVYLK